MAKTSQFSRTPRAGRRETRFRPFLHHRTIWTTARALLAGVYVPVMVTLMLKSLGLLHSVSLPTWLLDVQQNLGWGGALGSFGAGAAAAGGPVPPKDKDPDPCAGERRAVLADQGTVDEYKGQLDLYAQQIDRLAGPADQLVKQATALAPAAQSEVEEQFAMTALNKLLQMLVEAAGPLGEGAAAVSAGVGLVSDPLGSLKGGADDSGYLETGQFLSEMYQYFQVSQGNLNALEELCKEDPLPAAQQFLEAMSELQSLAAQGHTLVNAMNHVQDSLQQAQDKLAKDQQDLADCEASNTGDSTSAGDSANS